MVSLFGLKLGGGDRKKSQSKEPPKPPQRVDQNALGEGEFFGRDLARPQFPGSRPGSSRSNHNNVDWTAPYTGPIGASSMVDLSLPAPGRKGSFASLRPPNASAADRNTRWGNSSTTSLALPPPTIQGLRPGTPTRPKTATGRKDWVNPLDVHFGRDTSASRPVTRTGPVGGKQSRDQSIDATETRNLLNSETHHEIASLKASTHRKPSPEPPAQPAYNTNIASSTAPQVSSSLGQFDFGIKGLQKSTTLTSVATTSSSTSSNLDQGQTSRGFYGYPSPPKSVSPVSAYDNTSFSNKSAGPSSLRNLDTTIMRPPSPSSSSSGVLSPVANTADDDGDEWQAPVIRNVHAKRDTLTYHPPRRPSLTLELQTAEQARDRQARDDRDAVVGPGTSRDHDRHLAWRPKKPQLAEGLEGNFAAFDFGDSVRAPTVRTQRSVSPTGSWRSDTGTEKFPDMESVDSGKPEAAAPEQYAESPVEPRKEELWGNETTNTYHNTSRTGPRPSDPPEPQSHRPYQASPTRPFEDQQSYFPPAPAQRRQGPPRAAAGAHTGHRAALERGGYDLQGLTPSDAGPRGFAARNNADTHPRLRAPHLKPLLLQQQRSEWSDSSPAISSAYSQPFSDETDGPPTPEEFPLPQTQQAERPLSSPFNRPPMAGSFPQSKGLPRGRRPDPITIDNSPMNPPAPSTSSSRWRPWNSPSIVSPRSDSRSTHQQQYPYNPQDNGDQHGYTLPNWDDFDSAYDRHKSAMPAPLSPAPWSPTSTASSSALPPRLPSPTFPSLEKSISNSSPTLANSFELFYDDSKRQQRDEQHHQPLISPVMGSFGGLAQYQQAPPQRSPRRTEAQKAPPRPAPVTVPPSREGKSQQVSTAGNEFQASFI
ncbi:hypothetical protein S7711_05794 [Stachybotrys chartarum IBT 7711]|uniref:Uncharacterized protein n=1 Tax=Stachybotrys chartarum (strain CBS 109288 / IBT 7711) TaxID=1280523 RepID=A0A084ATI5_STACB|nr:hypothetical protein S7711_05794 [Stachybotrys chartarum IBT 7711]